MPTMTLSAIIPTKNRARDLGLAVRSLLVQTTLPDEILIVDQNADDSSLTVVQQEFASADANAARKVKVTYVHDAAIRGLTEARNRSLQIASGDVVLFLDDDVVLEPEFVQHLLGAYQQYPGAAGISGVVTNYPMPPLAFRLWKALFNRGPFHDDRQPIYWNADRLKNSPPIQVTRLGGGLMSFRSAAIRGCTFDENLFGFSAGEDVEFCSRLPKNSALYIAPRARLAHYFSPHGRETSHWVRRESRSTHYLYWRNWNNGLYPRVCFAWLNLGYFVVSLYGALRRGSFEPFDALRTGIREAKRTSGKYLRSSSSEQIAVVGTSKDA